MREHLEKWQQQWEKALADGVFDDAPKPSIPEPQLDFSDNQQDDVLLQDVDSRYWSQIYKTSLDSMINENAPVDDKELVDTTKPDNKTVAKITDELGGKANSVSAATRGKDASNKVTPNWAGGKDLIELHKLKEKLHKLGDKLAADPMADKKSLLSQFRALEDQIDELSDSIAPDFRTEYLS